MRLPGRQATRFCGGCSLYLELMMPAMLYSRRFSSPGSKSRIGSDMAAAACSFSSSGIALKDHSRVSTADRDTVIQ
eukprot:1185472-Prorocentrum_minimum.AAC.2